ncbi:hypothetical protein NL676_022353 [Syzygium grande]|nr:hypothetical protein NL676_022353 [Syzygium grande]
MEGSTSNALPGPSPHPEVEPLVMEVEPPPTADAHQVIDGSGVLSRNADLRRTISGSRLLRRIQGGRVLRLLLTPLPSRLPKSALLPCRLSQRRPRLVCMELGGRYSRLEHEFSRPGPLLAKVQQTPYNNKRSGVFEKASAPPLALNSGQWSFGAMSVFNTGPQRYSKRSKPR